MTYLDATAPPVDAEKSPDATAAYLLCGLMGDISEDQWCAGWLDGIETALWQMVQGGPRDWGFGIVSECEVSELRRLSERCGGWIVWTDDRCERWIPLTEWLPMFEADRNRWAAWQAKFDEQEALK